ncbi:methyl transferase [Alcanivorax sp. S71-1-4]|uniref:peptide chain release factor N(5)-glutamine methyltransferase n=1 Tax=Alcanivorax sp. S71-1-4 TaxID=1177159 RepID=UPI001359AA67|nr:peptide chain release factor N(5)-glutamine methyltransferase [Alcanivorax sp. S71-1-4]KAF0805104.1 methyl transferase [Alcanivorax sp. S71-1-4]
MSTPVATLLSEARAQLEGHSPSAALDARVLLAHLLGKPETFLFTWPEHEPTDSQQRQFREWIARRRDGVPVAHLVGRREFYGHEFLVSPDTLIPRPDTELLVDLALELLPGNLPQRLADLGTGTGAIAISLGLARPQWTVLAVDFTVAILDLAERNVRRLGATNVQVRQSSWCRDLPGQYHALVSNPPYIAENDPHLDEGDVRYEPRSALTAGADGLDDIRVLIEQAPSRLLPGGWLLLEHGYDQGDAVRALMAAGGFSDVQTRHDLGDRERVTLGRMPENSDAQ